MFVLSLTDPALSRPPQKEKRVRFGPFTFHFHTSHRDWRSSILTSAAVQSQIYRRRDILIDRRPSFLHCDMFHNSVMNPLHTKKDGAFVVWCKTARPFLRQPVHDQIRKKTFTVRFNQSVILQYESIFLSLLPCTCQWAIFGMIAFDALLVIMSVHREIQQIYSLRFPPTPSQAPPEKLRVSICTFDFSILVSASQYHLLHHCCPRLSLISAAPSRVV